MGESVGDAVCDDGMGEAVGDTVGAVGGVVGAVGVVVGAVGESVGAGPKSNSKGATGMVGGDGVVGKVKTWGWQIAPRRHTVVNGATRFGTYTRNVVPQGSA